MQGALRFGHSFARIGPNSHPWTLSRNLKVVAGEAEAGIILPLQRTLQPRSPCLRRPSPTPWPPAKQCMSPVGTLCAAGRPASTSKCRLSGSDRITGQCIRILPDCSSARHAKLLAVIAGRCSSHLFLTTKATREAQQRLEADVQTIRWPPAGRAGKIWQDRTRPPNVTLGQPDCANEHANGTVA